MLNRILVQKEAFRVGFLPGISTKFGICVDDVHIVLSEAYPGDVVTLDGVKRPFQSINHQPTLEKSLMSIHRISKFRHGKVATKCPNAEVKCHRCPWREMSAEAQLRLRIKVVGEFLFTGLKIRRDEVTDNFRIDNADLREMVDSRALHHTLYFGSGKNLKHRSVGTICQFNRQTDPFIESIHRNCRIMTPEIRETFSAINDWWAQYRDKPGWDSGQGKEKSKLLSLSVHHLNTTNDILVRIHAVGRGPSDYLLCRTASNTHLSETEATISGIINERLMSLGYTGKIHFSIMIRNPINRVRFLKIVTGKDVIFDRLRIEGTEILLPIRMAGTKIAYDRHPDQHRLLCREILKCVNRQKHSNILLVNEREQLDCTALSIALCLCKSAKGLSHLIYPVYPDLANVYSVADNEFLGTKKSRFTMPPREKALFEEVMLINKIPEGTIRDGFETSPSIDISIISHTTDLFRAASEKLSEGIPHTILSKIRESRAVYLIGTNLVDNMEIRRALVYLLDEKFRISCVRTISKFHSIEVGGFIELRKP